MIYTAFDYYKCFLFVRAIMFVVMLFLTTGWSVGLEEYIGRQRLGTAGEYLEGSTTFLTVFERASWRHSM